MIYLLILVSLFLLFLLVISILMFNIAFFDNPMIEKWGEKILIILFVIILVLTAIMVCIKYV